MKLSLSTNWCNRRLERGEEIVAAAAELGFEELELGFHTTEAQAAEIVKAGRLPIGSVHAFCPVPLSAPQGYPELYQLASFDDEARAMARFQVKKNIAFAASVGADALVLHAGRVFCECLFKRNRPKKRLERGKKMLDVFKRELEALVPELEKNRVTLGLENLPYPEGFPNLDEVREVTGDWVRPWFDTGHWFAMKSASPEFGATDIANLKPVGVHLNDSNGGDDHLPPGEGKIDFAALKELFAEARHIVFEPGPDVTAENLLKGKINYETITRIH